MKVVITGGSGFLGSNIIKIFLENGHEVMIILRENSITNRLAKFVTHQNYSEVQIDSEVLEDTIVKFQPEVFIHSAWKGVGNLVRNEIENIEENILYLQQCLELVRISGCKRWIGIGSLTEYGNLNKMFEESDSVLPDTIYANTKLAALYFSKSICLAMNVSWCWLRLGSIYGDGDNENWLIPYLIRSLKSNIIPDLTKCEQISDYLHVEDASFAILKVSANECSGIFNLCSSFPIKIMDIVKLIFKDSNLVPNYGGIEYSKNQLMYMVGCNKKLKNSIKWYPNKDFKTEIIKLIK